jgi:hypothetical protein
VTAHDNGLGPRRLSLPRAYVRTGDPFRSLPHDPLCSRTMSAPKTARRRRDESFCSVKPTLGGTSVPPILAASLHLELSPSGDDAPVMLPRAVWPPLARPPGAAVSRCPSREPTVSRRPASHWWSIPSRGDRSCVVRGNLSASAFSARERSPPHRHAPAPSSPSDDLRGWVIPGIVPTV